MNTRNGLTTWRSGWTLLSHRLAEITNRMMEQFFPGESRGGNSLQHQACLEFGFIPCRVPVHAPYKNRRSHSSTTGRDRRF